MNAMHDLAPPRAAGPEPGKDTGKAGLTVSIGQCSRAGRKDINQDFHGALIPSEPELSRKGISVAMADGISSSTVSQIAAEMAVKSFLTDYYCTCDTWTVKTAGDRVIRATNSWLHAETRRSIHAHDLDRGHVCTFSALVLQARMAHLFHVGDSRIFRLQGETLEQLTEDHRTVVSGAQSHLARALGMGERIEVDYRALPLSQGDTFVLTTDGVHEFCSSRDMARAILAHRDDLQEAARRIVALALEGGSTDNLTVQVVRVDSLPDSETEDAISQADALPAPPPLEAGQLFEGYRLLRPLHISHRSHVWLVENTDTGSLAALKLPSVDLRADARYLRRFMIEDWIARRIASAHVLRALPPLRPGRFIYTVTEYVQGQTLAQWMTDNPRCHLETMRGIVEQIAKGLRAFHRREMLHQDLRPENIMIDKAGTVKIIDFGAVHVAGVTATRATPGQVPGAMQYAAPEYFLAEPADRRADYYSLGVIAYQMLTGRLPYGAAPARLRSPAQRRRLRYRPIRDTREDIPPWIDAALAKAVHPDPRGRHDSLSEFLADLRRPDPDLLPTRARPLLERNPVAFWRALCAILLAVALAEWIWLNAAPPDSETRRPAAQPPGASLLAPSSSGAIRPGPDARFELTSRETR